MIQYRIIERFGLSQSDLARALGISAVRVHQILKGRTRISAELALRLAKITGTAPHYWLRLQADFDLFRASGLLVDDLDRLRELGRVGAERSAGKRA